MPLSAVIADLENRTRVGVRRATDFPKVMVFDWNGTIDARGVGVGIPSDVLVALQKLGKTVIIYTSSVNADRKLFLRKWAEQHGIPYTDNPKILKSADMFVGDKRSDERRAGRYGVTFVYTNEFSLEKVVPKVVHKAGIESHLQIKQCTCDRLGKKKNADGASNEICSCQVIHP